MTRAERSPLHAIALGRATSWLGVLASFACSSILGIEELSLASDGDTEPDAALLASDTDTDTEYSPVTPSDGGAQPGVDEPSTGSDASDASEHEAGGDETGGSETTSTEGDSETLEPDASAPADPNVTDATDEVPDGSSDAGEPGERYAPGPEVHWLSAGDAYTCVVREGLVYCWGRNAERQLGHNGTNVRTPRLVPGLSDIVAVSAATKHTCALRSDGKVLCWGEGTMGQLGSGYTNSDRPVEVFELEGVAAIGAGLDHTCAVRHDGRVLCWGSGNTGKLGDGLSSAHAEESPREVAGLDAIVGISAGVNHTCVVRDDGVGFCWGHAFQGKLGPGSRRGGTESHSTPFEITTPTDLVSINAGHSHSCAVQGGGLVFCWGNHPGAGDGTTPVSGLLGTRFVSAGYYHSCALGADGVARCWGAGSLGRLGNGSTAVRDEHTALEVPGLEGLVAVSAGGSHSCALRNDGKVFCWGGGAQGQLGNGDISDQPTPVEVADFPAP